MKQQKQQKEYGKKFFVPILLILAVLPLITNAHIYDNGLSKQLWSSANGQVTDFFLYYKSHFDDTGCHCYGYFGILALYW